ncbi:unnamed protein product, partial [Polarella glacialis]
MAARRAVAMPWDEEDREAAAEVLQESRKATLDAELAACPPGTGWRTPRVVTLPRPSSEFAPKAATAARRSDGKVRSVAEAFVHAPSAQEASRASARERSRPARAEKAPGASGGKGGLKEPVVKKCRFAPWPEAKSAVPKRRRSWTIKGL